MTSPRTLNLKKERLTELTTDDLHRVAAAAPDAPTGLDVCASVFFTGCQSFRYCTTAPSCGCGPTTVCQTTTCQ